ncbi:hypothetical protein [Thiofilum flexile]|uniref:hypothetical protein n=1 Tax=Thiofilum flexile TaxID=125627 RepID=UPI000379A76B|nr:hypothetical protein [Thiofilum flexile]
MHTDATTTVLSAPVPFAYSDREAQLTILQHAFTEVLKSHELREADPPMLDVLYSLNERFNDLLKRD